MEITEYENELKSKLTEVRRKIDESKEELENAIKDIDATSECKNSGHKKYTNEVSELVKSLDEETRNKLFVIKGLEKKVKNCKYVGLSVFIISSILIGIFCFNKLSFTSENTLKYLFIAVAIIIGSIASTALAKVPFKMMIRKLRADSNIIEYTKKELSLYKVYLETEKNQNNIKNQLVDKKYDITQRISKLKEQEENLLNSLHELEFNYQYRNTILFYGKERNNRYDLYLDGHLYDTVSGKRIIKIMLSPGIHSFKVENTNYNIVDGSVNYAFTFETKQVIVGEEPQALAVVCDYNRIDYVSGSEFEKITKTKLT